MNGCIFQTVHWVIFWTRKIVKTCKNFINHVQNNNDECRAYSVNRRVKKEIILKLKALVVCNLSGWKGISEKHIIDLPMFTQLCNAITQKGFPWVIQVKRESCKSVRYKTNQFENYFCSRLLPSMQGKCYKIIQTHSYMRDFSFYYLLYFIIIFFLLLFFRCVTWYFSAYKLIRLDDWLNNINLLW